MVDFATKAEAGGVHEAQGILCVFLYPARGVTIARTDAITDGFDRRWQGITLARVWCSTLTKGLTRV